MLALSSSCYCQCVGLIQAPTESVTPFPWNLGGPVTTLANETQQK